MLVIKVILFEWSSPGSPPCWIRFYLSGLNSITAWINDDIHYKVSDEITYPFPNFNVYTFEV